MVSELRTENTDSRFGYSLFLFMHRFAKITGKRPRLIDRFSGFVNSIE